MEDARARSSLTVYGIVDDGITYVSNVGGHAVVQQSPGVFTASRFRVKGGKDLGGGPRAIFQLENAFTLNNGTFGQGSAGVTRQLGRQAFVGLASPYGTVTGAPVRVHVRSRLLLDGCVRDIAQSSSGDAHPAQRQQRQQRQHAGLRPGRGSARRQLGEVLERKLRRHRVRRAARFWLPAWHVCERIDQELSSSLYAAVGYQRSHSGYDAQIYNFAPTDLAENGQLVAHVGIRHLF